MDDDDDDDIDIAMTTRTTRTTMISKPKKYSLIPICRKIS